MQIETTRFGRIECPDEQKLRFERGLIGFYDEQEFMLINHGQSELIAWLQSTTTPDLAFPVVSVHAFSGYPDVEVKQSAERAGLTCAAADFAIMAVLAAPRGQPATVNLLAPLIIDTTTRQGAQVVLDNTRFSARELFVLPPSPDQKAQPARSEPSADEQQTG